MQNYFDVVQDQHGNAIPGASVTVLNANGTPATLFSDNVGTPATNPLTTNADGEYSFFAANGRYSLTIQATGYTPQTKSGIILFDPAESSASNDINFIQAGTSAVIRTVQSKLRDVVSVKDFGAIGNGTADDTAAFTAAINYVLANGKALFAPAGTYNITSLITATMPNPAVGPQATNFFAQFVIYGEGFGRTVINCTTSGFVKVIGSSQQHSVEFTDMTIAAGTTGTQIAIEMDCSAYPWFAEHTARSTIRCEFRGNDGMSLTKHWSTCVIAKDWSHIDFSGSSFNGASTPAGRAVYTYASAAPFVCKFYFVAAEFRFLNVGYEYGDGSQSVFLDSCFFGLNITDIKATAGGNDHQGLSVVNCECYELGTGPFLLVDCDVPNLTFTSNRIAVSAGQTAVVLNITNQTTICDNQFFPDTNPNTATSAISIDGTVSGSHCIIEDNNFAGTTIGAQLKSGSANVRFGSSNKWTAGMTGVTNAGTNNVIGVGYAPGWGGTVTQATSKSTAVTINNVCGRITTANDALGGGAEVGFTVNNSTYAATDVVIVQPGNGNYDARVTDGGAGSFVIRLKNISGGSLSDAVAINFAVIKAATS